MRGEEGDDVVEEFVEGNAGDEGVREVVFVVGEVGEALEGWVEFGGSAFLFASA